MQNAIRTTRCTPYSQSPTVVSGDHKFCSQLALALVYSAHLLLRRRRAAKGCNSFGSAAGLLAAAAASADSSASSASMLGPLHGEFSTLRLRFSSAMLTASSASNSSNSSSRLATRNTAAAPAARKAPSKMPTSLRLHSSHASPGSMMAVIADVLRSYAVGVCRASGMSGEEKAKWAPTASMASP